MKKSWALSYPLSARRRLWSDWADAKADLSFRWAHTHFVGFVMSRLIYSLMGSQRRGLWLYGPTWLKKPRYLEETTDRYPASKTKQGVNFGRGGGKRGLRAYIVPNRECATVGKPLTPTVFGLSRCRYYGFPFTAWAPRDIQGVR